MEDLNFAKPAPATLYDPEVALAFFKSAGKIESVPQGKTFFAENDRASGFFSRGDRMYLLLEGEVGLTRRNQAIGTVRQGEIFGELATVGQMPRSATAIAKTACRVISLDEKQFRQAIEAAPEFALMLMNILISRLRATIARVSGGIAQWDEDAWNKCSVFEKKLLAELIREMDDRPPLYHPTNKVIMSEGEAGAFMYVVVEGTVAVSIRDKIVEKVGPGGVFGEMALVDQSPRSATAVAQTDCSLLAINRNDFLALVKSKPAFGVTLLKALAERLRFMTAHV
jgi:CRP-like cAMP-binding protein